MSKLSVGIVGLPNVGKSTLFRALTAIAVPAENYPFCTVDRNVGVVEVPDDRLRRLGELAGHDRRVSTVIEFVDIAGLVEGASQGEGLGNRFLSHIRDVDALAHVIRFFVDPAVARADQRLEQDVDPRADRRVVELELALADSETIAAAAEKAEKKARSGDREAEQHIAVLRRIAARMDEGMPARLEPLTPEEEKRIGSLGLLTRKPVLYVANVSEDQLVQGEPVLDEFRAEVARVDAGAEVLELCARLEADLLELEPPERLAYLAEAGIEAGGLARLIQAAYRLLGLQTFFTIGDHEVRAWTVRVGATAPEAAGRVHSDFERGFIRAETISFADFEQIGSMKEAKEHGLLRSEGRDYLVQDGDVLFFRAAP